MIAAGCLLCAIPVADARTWKDVTGKFSVEADFVSLDGDQVTLRNAEGKEATLPLAKLRPEDREYAKQKHAKSKSSAGASSVEAKATLSRVTSVVEDVEKESHQLRVEIDILGGQAADAYAIGKPEIKPITLGGQQIAARDLGFGDDFDLIERGKDSFFAEHPEGGVRVDALFPDVPGSTQNTGKIEGSVKVLAGGKAKKVELGDIGNYPKGPIQNPALEAAGLGVDFDRASKGEFEVTLKFKVESKAFAGMQLVGADGKPVENLSTGTMAFGDVVSRSISTHGKLGTGAKLVIHLREGGEEVELPFVLDGVEIGK